MATYNSSSTSTNLNPCGSVPQFLNEKQTAERLTLSLAALRRWRQEGRGPVVTKIGTRVVYAESDIIAWLNTCRKCGGEHLSSTDAVGDVR